MKKTGIVLIVIGNILNIMSGLTIKRKVTTYDDMNEEIVKETESGLVCPRWSGVALLMAGCIVYLAGLRRKTNKT
ncbi:MAG: hypothetical protein IH597_11075 [Bacteroidales bacterium]|nr:hypothetical protein [Bacteroidales bacterium]